MFLVTMYSVHRLGKEWLANRGFGMVIGEMQGSLVSKYDRGYILNVSPLNE